MIGARWNDAARAGAVGLLVAASGCADAGDAARRGDAVASGAPTVVGSAVPTARGSASAAASAAAPPPAPWAGAWSGTYRAVKASPTLDPTVKVKSWASDDGTAATGDGPLRLEVGDGGVVRGEIGPPLGPGDVRGVVEADRLLATIVPRDEGPDAFGGTVDGKLDGGALVVTIQASDGAAVTVRRGEAKLAR